MTMSAKPSLSTTLRKIEVRTPASTANLGPGFDCMGLALDIYDSVTLSLAEETGELAHQEGLDKQHTDLVLLAARRLYQEIGLTAPELAAVSQRAIPLGRGLGSSAAAIVAGLLGANALAGNPLTQEAVGELAAQIEGHPDNSSPCLYGGFQLCVTAEERLVHLAIPLPAGLNAVLFIPGFAMPTHETRRLLPTELSRGDVVFQTSRAALVIAALATGKVNYLRLATQDRLHQPARGKVFPGMWALFEAALDAGALCAYLSGGGPTVLALTPL